MENHPCSTIRTWCFPVRVLRFFFFNPGSFYFILSALSPRTSMEVGFYPKTNHILRWAATGLFSPLINAYTMREKKIGCLPPAHHRSQRTTVLSPASALDHYSLWCWRVKNDLMLDCTVPSICCNKLVWCVVAFNFITQESFRAFQMWFCYTIGMSWKVKREGNLRKTLTIPTQS